jgi:hypothetical protein
MYNFLKKKNMLRIKKTNTIKLVMEYIFYIH